MGFLNINGLKTSSKWEEVYYNSQKLKLNACFFAETKHTGDEKYPGHKLFNWHSNNREAGEKKGGGIGALWVKTTNLYKHKICKEHSWYVIQEEGQAKVFVGVVYMATGSSQSVRSGNSKIRKCLTDDISHILAAGKQKICILGDFNAHIEETNDLQDSEGTELKNFSWINDLIIMNTSQKCKGVCTWQRGESKSSIDYVLANREFEEVTSSIEIDEEGLYSATSDHNLITVTWRGHSARKKKVRGPLVKKAGGRWKVSDEKTLQKYTEAMELDIEDSDEALNYDGFIGLMKTRGLQQCGKTKPCFGQKNQPRWLCKTVKQAIKERKIANSEHRTAIKAKESKVIITKKWDMYKIKKHQASTLIADKINLVNRDLERELTNGSANTAKKLWRYLKKNNDNKKKDIGLRDKEGTLRNDSAGLNDIIIQHFKETQENGNQSFREDTSENEPIHRITQELPNPFTEEELKTVVQKLPSGKAVGPEDIPNELIKNLGKKAMEVLRHLLNKVWIEGVVPEIWKTAYIKLIHKGKDKPVSDISAYRPIALLSNVYKVYTKLIRNRLNQYLETAQMMGDMQNGFRCNRSTNDSIYTITQTIEIAKKENRKLYIAFLDIKGAYDNVDRSILWQRLTNLNVSKHIVSSIQKLYENTKNKYFLGDFETEIILNYKGVRQGCPLSPTLFNTYMKPLEGALVKGNKGFNIGDGNICNGTFYADDSAVLAGSSADIQSQLDIASEFGANSSLDFSEEKSEIMIFNNNEREPQVFYLQGKQIAVTDSVRYLGILLNSHSQNYLDENDTNKLNKAKKLKAMTKNCSRFTFNKYVVARTLWKQVAVPALTYGSEVITLQPETRKELNYQQKEVGKFALGANHIAPNISIEGEMGWSNFEGREAKAKNNFMGKLLLSNDTSMNKKLFNITQPPNKKTNWQRRTNRLRSTFQIKTNTITHNKLENWRKTVNKEVNDKNEENWRKAVKQKESLTFYSQKQKPQKEPFYENSLGSDLLFQARTNSLPTADRENLVMGGNPVCKRCGADRETVKHILLECPSFNEERRKIRDMDKNFSEVEDTANTIARWLGFCDTRRNQEQIMGITKNLLVKWWKTAKHRPPYWRS